MEAAAPIAPMVPTPMQGTPTVVVHLVWGFIIVQYQVQYVDTKIHLTVTCSCNSVSLFVALPLILSTPLILSPTLVI